ncbi:unnamed protein product [Linum trigynum]
MAVSEDLDGFWVRLKYEFLPTFCYHCGHVGHSRRDYSFDPPIGTEKFDPHMSMKKLGRKIYDDVDGSTSFRGNRGSVWINRHVRQQGDGVGVPNKGRGPVIQLGETERKNKGLARPPVQAQNHEGENPTHTSPKPIPKPKNTLSSPRGFPVCKSPVSHDNGGPRRLQRQSPAGGRTRPLDSGNRNRPMKAHRREGGSSHFIAQATPDVMSEMQAVLEQTRRRRLILDDDSDDDEPIPGHAESSVANRKLEGTLNRV